MAPSSEQQGQGNRMDLLKVLANTVPNLVVRNAVQELEGLRTRFAAAAARSSKVAEEIAIFQGGAEFEGPQEFEANV